MWVFVSDQWFDPLSTQFVEVCSPLLCSAVIVHAFGALVVHYDP